MGADERVARFLFSKSDFSAPKKRAKPSAFDPSPHDELSVGHISGLDAPAIWAMGDVVRKLLGRSALLARADLDVSDVLTRRLKSVRDDNPFQGHTNVVGWPPIADANERKRVWKGIATHLASKSKLEIR